MRLMDFSALVQDLSRVWLFNFMASIFPVTFSSALTQPSALVIAWTLSFLKTAHLQNLLIQSFYSLATASCLSDSGPTTKAIPWPHQNLQSFGFSKLSLLIVTLLLHFPHYSTLNPGSIFSIRLLPIFSSSCPPCPFVIFIGQNNSVFYVFTSGCQEYPEKNYTIWQNILIHDHLPQLDSTLPGNLPCFSRADCSPRIYKHHLKSFFLSSNLLAFSPFYSLFSEKTQPIWCKQPQFPANKSSNQPVSVPSVPTSFLLLFREGVSPPFKGCLFLYLRATPFCFLRTLSSSFLPSHSLIFNFFFSSIGPVS